MGRITAILKLTHECNLDCTYCYYCRGQKSDLPAKLSIENIEIILDKLSGHYNHIELILHGGEPLLWGLDNFSRLVRIEKKITEHRSITFKNSIQTNGTIYSPELSNLFVTNDIGIGISLDGLEITHDKNRLFKTTHLGTFKTIKKNISSFKNDGIKLGIISVANKTITEKPKDIYLFFKENGLNFKINELICSDINNYLYPSDDELFQFYKEIFDLWISDTKEPILKINPFSNIISGFWYDSVSACTYLGNCHSYFSIETDGSVFPCGRFNHIEEFKLGNIINNSWIEILESDNLTKIACRKKIITKICCSCKWLKMCWGGCSASSYYYYKNLNSPTPLCNVRKKLFEYIYYSIINIRMEVKNGI